MALWQIVLTCEHGGNEVPKEYKSLFTSDPAVLLTHRGLDIGALTWAEWLAKKCSCPLIFSKTSRLLVDLNRSLKSRSLFSPYALELSYDKRQDILDRFYFPYRQEVTDLIQKFIRNNKRVLHLSIHSFTPVLNGIQRNADVGLLYDPRRPLEKKVCRALASTSVLALRYNYPYRGTADGLTTTLRKYFSASDYLGIEIEINQRFGVKGSQVEEAVLCPLLLAINTIIGE
jgi:predicted N-formylglutamate amidohydrolase